MSNNYTSDAIVELEGLAHVRFKPAMYGCDPFSKQGVFLLVKEILDNAIDEARMDPSHQHDIKVLFIRTNTGIQVVIRDCGRGIPLDKIEPVFTKIGVSGKWEGAYQASGGTHGVGSKATVAMSKHFCAISSRNGEGQVLLTVKDCNVVHNKIDRRKKNLDSGTTIFFEPDTTLMSNIMEFFDVGEAYDDLLRLMNFVTVFVPNIAFHIYDGIAPIDTTKLDSVSSIESMIKQACPDKFISTETGMTPIEYYLNRNGIRQDVVAKGSVSANDINVNIVRAQQGPRQGDPDNIVRTTNTINYKVEYFMTSDFNLRGAGTLGAVNMINIDDKTSVHNRGVLDALKATLMPYVEEKYQEFFDSKYYHLPIHVISVVEWQVPHFSGQSKDRFLDTDFYKGFVKSLKKEFNAFPVSEWELLHSMLADDIKAKYDRKHRLDNDLAKSSNNLAFELGNIECFHDCRSKDPSITELIVCEGVSASGYAKRVRNSDTQAVFTLGGKPLNTIKTTFTEAMKNRIFKDFVTVLGTSPNDDELADVRFGKVVILTDADNDGYHITALLIGILYTINKRFLEEGRVIIASPPLYIIKHKNASMFVRNNNALLDFKAEAYAAILDITLVAGERERLLEEAEFRMICHVIDSMGQLFNHIGNQLNVDPNILEQLVHCVDDIETLNTDNIRTKLGLTRCEYEKSSNTLLLDVGNVDIVIPLNGLVRDIRGILIPEMERMNYKDVNFKVTSKQTSLYVNDLLSIMEIYAIFELINKEFSISRMKGLGEMKADFLKSTCVDPATRSFVMVRSPGDVERIFGFLGVDTTLRRSVIMENVD